VVPRKIKFEEYFQAYKNRKEFLTCNNEEMKHIDFTIEPYSEVLEKIQKYEEKNPQTLSKDQIEELNLFNDNSFFDLLIEMIKTESNVFIYGYGSKLKLIYDFLNYFNENSQDDSASSTNLSTNVNYYTLVFNCYNPEMNIKYILGEIQSCLIQQLEQSGLSAKELKEFAHKSRTLEEQITLIHNIERVLVNMEFFGKFIIIINNIDGPNFQNKMFQNVLSQLVDLTEFVFIVTSDNLYINYLWTQTIKDCFSFYFLKYNTFVPYQYEINDKTSLVGEKNVKSGAGLIQILKSLTKNQREVIKVMAQIQIKGDLNMMTSKALVEYMAENCLGVCNNQNRFMELILEPKDHEIVIEKTLPKTNKEIYKLNLDPETLEKFANGEFDKLEG